MVEVAPVESPPEETLVVGAPPVETPPVENTPVEGPPVEVPVEEPLVETTEENFPPMGRLSVENRFENSPVVNPPIETNIVESLPAEDVLEKPDLDEIRREEQANYANQVISLIRDLRDLDFSSLLSGSRDNEADDAESGERGGRSSRTSERRITPRNYSYTPPPSMLWPAANPPAVPKELVIREAPYLSITEPMDKVLYYDKIKLSGLVRNSSIESGKIDGITSLSWFLRGVSEPEEILLSRNGDFTLELPMENLDFTRQLIVSAENKEGLETKVSLILKEDIRPPAIELLSPENGDLFGRTINITGRVLDYEGADSSDRIASTWISIPQTGEELQLELQSGGYFQISIETPEDELLFIKCIAENTRQIQGESSIIVYNENHDNSGPFVNITTPVYHDSYGALVNVEGWLCASSSELNSPARFSELNWEILGTNDGGRIRPDRDGNFDFGFSTIGMDRTICLVIRGKSREGLNFFSETILHADQSKAYSDLISPIDNTLYDDDYVSVRGVVGNSSEAVGRIDELKSLYWWVPGLSREKNPVFFEEDGTFLYSMDLSGMSGPVILEILAETISGAVSEKTFRLYDGTRSPEIALTSPGKDSRYGMGVIVSGKVFDPYANLERYGGIEALEYEVVPMEYDSENDTAIFGSIVPEQNGDFEFSFDSTRMKGPQAITLMARASNGNQGVFSFTMQPGEDDIPTFMVITEGSGVRMYWENIPQAQSYSVYYTTDGTLPDENNGRKIDNVTSPTRINGLPIGNICSFVLEAHTANEPGLSGMKKTIPIGTNGFSLIAEGEYEAVTLSWAAFPQIPSYHILREDGGSGVFRDISGAVSDERYIDLDVEYGIEYRYKLSPDGFPDISGRTVSTQTLAIPEKRIASKADVSDFIPNSLVVHGGYAYVAAGDAGFKIVDIGDPNQIGLIAGLHDFHAERICIYGDYAYIASGPGGIKVLNIQEARDPILLGSRSSTNALDIQVVGTTAYLADGEGGLRVIDVSNPRVPNRIISFSEHLSERLGIEDGYLYSTHPDSGMKIFNINDPESPEFITEYRAETAGNLIIDKNTGYLSLRSGSIQIIDLTDKSNPKLISSLEISTPGELKVQGNYLFAANGDSGFKIFNVADPENPTLVDETEDVNVLGLDIDGNTLYVAGREGLQILDVHLQGGTFLVASCNLPGRPVRVRLNANRAYLAAGSEGVYVIDISNPSKVDDTSWVGYDPAEDANDFAFYKDWVLLADGVEGVKIFEDKIAPSDDQPSSDSRGSFPDNGTGSFGFLHTAGWIEVSRSPDIRSILVNDNFALLGDYNNGLIVADISPLDSLEREEDTSSGIEYLTIVELDSPRALFAFGNILYVACRNEVVVLNITEPSSPVRTGEIPLKRITSISGFDQKILMTNSSGIHVYSVNDPLNPVFLYKRDSGFAENVWTNGKFAYFSEGYLGLTVLDVSSNGVLEPVSICDTIYAVASEAEGNYAFVVDAEKFNVVQIFIPEWLTR
ncbi:MAG: hypothetical protein JEY99_20675 [Spirochaetales bacterium]|nr:hypothetical protein [Spirochaetales bacterium]